MSSSGVLVNPECQSTFHRMAEGKKEFCYIIYKIEKNEVCIDKSVLHSDMSAQNDSYEDNSKAAYEEFASALKSATDDFVDCRYAVFDFKFSIQRQGAGKTKIDKLIFIQLCPDGAPIKKKMVYASTAGAIKSALGTNKMLQFQVSDESELSHAELLGKMNDKFSDN